jgi:hypothetical protein
MKIPSSTTYDQGLVVTRRHVISDVSRLLYSMTHSHSGLSFQAKFPWMWTHPIGGAKSDAQGVLELTLGTMAPGFPQSRHDSSLWWEGKLQPKVTVVCGSDFPHSCPFLFSSTFLYIEQGPGQIWGRCCFLYNRTSQHLSYVGRKLLLIRGTHSMSFWTLCFLSLVLSWVFCIGICLRNIWVNHFQWTFLKSRCFHSRPPLLLSQNFFQVPCLGQPLSPGSGFVQGCGLTGGHRKWPIDTLIF